MFTPKPNAAIVIIGHGSTLNPDSSTPTFQHADEIRSRGLFAEVACCFWKEEPSMREVAVQGQQLVVQVPGLRPTPIPVWLTLLTGIFMHGSIMHLLGNMWFLWLFGDNVEDCMGHVRYLLFYLACGILASLAFVATNATGEASLTPCLGASGAISGVLGAYLVLHPQRRVSVILLRMMVDVPGYMAVGIWFLFQVVSGLFDTGGGGGGVAYSAHVAGFLAGMVLAKPMSAGWARAEADPLVILRRRIG